LKFFRSQFAEGSYLGMIGAATLSGGGALLRGVDASIQEQGIEVRSTINPFTGFSVAAKQPGLYDRRGTCVGRLLVSGRERGNRRSSVVSSYETIQPCRISNSAAHVLPDTPQQTYQGNCVARLRGVCGYLAVLRSELACSKKSPATAAQAQLDQRRWQDQLAKASDSWLSVISGVLDQLPDDVWVSRIETSPKDATLQIDGRATDYDTLSVFVDRLRRDRTFSDIRLGTVRIARIGELTCLEFTVPMKLRVGGEASQPAPDTQASAASEGGSGA